LSTSLSPSIEYFLLYSSLKVFENNYNYTNKRNMNYNKNTRVTKYNERKIESLREMVENGWSQYTENPFFHLKENDPYGNILAMMMSSWSVDATEDKIEIAHFQDVVTMDSEQCYESAAVGRYEDMTEDRAEAARVMLTEKSYGTITLPKQIDSESLYCEVISEMVRLIGQVERIPGVKYHIVWVTEIASLAEPSIIKMLRAHPEMMGTELTIISQYGTRPKDEVSTDWYSSIQKTYVDERDEKQVGIAMEKAQIVVVDNADSLAVPLVRQKASVYSIIMERAKIRLDQIESEFINIKGGSKVYAICSTISQKLYGYHSVLDGSCAYCCRMNYEYPRNTCDYFRRVFREIHKEKVEPLIIQETKFGINLDFGYDEREIECHPIIEEVDDRTLRDKFISIDCSIYQPREGHYLRFCCEDRSRYMPLYLVAEQVTSANRQVILQKDVAALQYKKEWLKLIDKSKLEELKTDISVSSISVQTYSRFSRYVICGAALSAKGWCLVSETVKTRRRKMQMSDDEYPTPVHHFDSGQEDYNNDYDEDDENGQMDSDGEDNRFDFWSTILCDDDEVEAVNCQFVVNVNVV